MRTVFFVLFAFLFATAHCANVFQVACESGPFDVAEAEKELNCSVHISANFQIGQLFGYAVIALNEPANEAPNYVPKVEHCSQTFSSPTSSASLNCVVHLARFAADGVYTFTAYAVSSDETVYIHNSTTFEVEAEKNDRVPPTIVSITAPRYYNAKFPTSNWVVLHLADDASGIKQIYYSIHTTPQGGDELFFGNWPYATEAEHEAGEHGHDHEHEHEEEGSEEEGHEHEHGEEDESILTDFTVTLPLSLRAEANTYTPGTYYLSLHLWDAFWDVRVTNYQLRTNGFTWNVTLLPSSNCVAGKYAHNTKKPNTCSNCPTGTYSHEGATKCAACPAGSIPNPARSECVQCPLGSYEVNGSVCAPCPQGQSAPLGATSSAQCEKIL